MNIPHCLVCGHHEEFNISLYRFPQDENRSSEWLRNMFPEQHATMPNKTNDWRICRRHFDRTSFYNEIYWQLQNSAIPTLLPSSNNEPFLEYNLDEHLLAALKDFTHDKSTPDKQRVAEIVQNKQQEILQFQVKLHSKGIRKALKYVIYNPRKSNRILKGLSEGAVSFIVGIIQTLTKKSKESWTPYEIHFAPILLRTHPQMYSIMQTILPLPTPKTINSYLRLIPFKTGVNTKLLQKMSQTYSIRFSNLCVLVFGVAPITAHLEYRNGIITGVEDFGSYRSNKLANRILLFMLQGIHTKFKQPIAYYFYQGVMKAEILKSLIVEVIKAVQKNNMRVVATISNLSRENRAVVKMFSATPTEPYYEVDDERIVHIFDVPDLLKRTRDVFSTHDIEIPVKKCGGQIMTARWSDLHKAYKHSYNKCQEDKQKYGSSWDLFSKPFLWKVKENDFYPTKKNCDNIEVAARVLCRTIPCYLHYSWKHYGFDPSVQATMEFALYVDKMFDSLNGKSRKNDGIKELDFKSAIGTRTGHIRYWPTAIKFVESWKILPKYTEDASDIMPIQDGWIHTLNAFTHITMDICTTRLLWALPEISARYFNMDALVNLFTATKFHCGNKDPTCDQIVTALKTQVYNANFSRATFKAPRENDRRPLLIHLADSANEDNGYTDKADTEENFHNIDLITSKFSIAYISGLIAKRLIHTNNCITCQDELITMDDSFENMFITCDEFIVKDRVFQPSFCLANLVADAVTYIETNFRHHLKKNNILKSMKDLLVANLESPFVCSDHRSVLFASIIHDVCVISIQYFCNTFTNDRNPINELTKKLEKVLNV